MSNLFQENKNAFLLLLGLFFVLLIVLYIALFRPLASELEDQEGAVSSLHTDVSILKVKAEKLKETPLDTSHLEMKIPLRRELKKILHSLQDVEELSNSEIHSISFNYTNQLPSVDFEEESDEDLDENIDEEDDDQHDQDEVIDDVDADESARKVIPMDEKPENLEMISIHMSVLSPDFDHFEKFIKEIEQLDRITIISSLDFNRPDQWIEMDEQSEMMEFSIELLTFYYLD